MLEDFTKVCTCFMQPFRGSVHALLTVGRKDSRIGVFVPCERGQYTHRLLRKKYRMSQDLSLSVAKSCETSQFHFKMLSFIFQFFFFWKKHRIEIIKI